MMKYIVTIEETMSQDFEVNADNIDMAIEIAKERYNKREYVLEPGNLLYKTISGISLGDGQIKRAEEF